MSVFFFIYIVIAAVNIRGGREMSRPPWQQLEIASPVLSLLC